MSEYAFAVVRKSLDGVEVTFLGKANAQSIDRIKVDRVPHKNHRYAVANPNLVIKILVDAGFRVRFYETDQRHWMEQHPDLGVFSVPGNPDGSWGIPSSEEYLKNYLGITDSGQQEESVQC